ncbi:hypothetical protein [Saccharothrix algeriensis]|uniref:TfoX N-terminal domain-containing protein n=1 Tax=Saccharothrix algeriensis TaxID=173560 RepID=A0ABS2S3F7_9PSEU|nr:hypothetical protein [Saccharothrix algeriensis]MBM7810454.1 hypothetical protein [Saccharothrix algeriensis]
MTAGAKEAFEELAEEVAPQGFTVSRMFGLPCLKYGGKAIVALQGEGVAFKLGAGTGELTAALAAEGAEPFDPAGTGRPMKDWVRLPASSAGTWVEHARVAASRLG